MKLALAAIALLAAAPVVAFQGGTQQVSAAQNGQTITMKVGGDLVVTLPANASTGFGWMLAQLPEGVELVSMTYATTPPPANATAPMVGRGGTATFRFQATGEGGGPIQLVYRRGRPATAPAAKSYELDIEIE
jgi:inhibitor of cysteine peptidase